ncbi:MAG: NYN domain-containing protein [Leptolyngbya sp.]|nr:NYN domain-containing protein [Leptolyngbya sp.]
MSIPIISIQRHCPTVVIAVDGQNVGLWKNSNAILKFASDLGTVSIQWVYHNCRNLRPSRESRLQDQDWQFVDVAVSAKNELDRRMMADIKKLCRSQPPDVLILVTNDKDFAPLVEDMQRQGVKVVVIGRRHGMSKKLKRCLPNDIVYIEDLKPILLAS